LPGRSARPRRQHLSQDPRFCNLAALDFRLRPESPCLEKNNDCGDMGAISETCGSDPADIPERGETWQPMEIGLEPNPFVHDAALILRLSAADGMDVDIYDTA